MNERQKPIHPQPKSCEISGCGLLGNGVKCQWCGSYNTQYIDHNGSIQKYVCNKCFKTFRIEINSGCYLNHRNEELFKYGTSN